MGAALGPVFAGSMSDQSDSYRLAFALLSLGTFAAVPLMLSIRRPGLSSLSPAATLRD